MARNDDAGSLTPCCLVVHVFPVGAAEGCDLLILIFSNLQIAKAKSKDRSLRQLLQIFRYLCSPRLSAHPLVRRGGGQLGRPRTCRSSPRHKISFDIIGALDEYSFIACDLVECDNKYRQPLPFGDSAMNTGSRRTLLIATAQASHGHNGNNWIVAQAN